MLNFIMYIINMVSGSNPSMWLLVAENLDNISERLYYMAGQSWYWFHPKLFPVIAWFLNPRTFHLSGLVFSHFFERKGMSPGMLVRINGCTCGTARLDRITACEL